MDNLQTSFRPPYGREQGCGVGRFRLANSSGVGVDIDDLYRDWIEHGAEAIRQVREDRPSDYLKVIALIVAKGDMDNNFAVTIAHDQELAQIIEERRQQALLQIEKLRGEPRPAWPNGRNGEHD
jgi:hypothetical protein